jgi:transcriptional regulator with XRE-family HTH domain
MDSISPKLCKAGRALLGWSRNHLADASGLNVTTVADYERGDRDTYESTRAKLQEALEGGGIVFLAVGKVRGVGAEE